MEKIIIHSQNIKLSQFLKWAGIAESGGQAKEMILSGLVQINGIDEWTPGKKVMPGDIVSVATRSYLITNDE